MRKVRADNLHRDETFKTAFERASRWNLKERSFRVERFVKGNLFPAHVFRPSSQRPGVEIRSSKINSENPGRESLFICVHMLLTVYTITMNGHCEPVESTVAWLAPPGELETTIEYDDCYPRSE